jgi:hypothetical protein
MYEYEKYDNTGMKSSRGRSLTIKRSAQFINTDKAAKYVPGLILEGEVALSSLEHSD